MTTKRCPKCEELKGAQDFGVNRTKRDGLQSWCKECRVRANNARYFVRRREDPEFRARRAKQARETKNPLRRRRDVARERAQRKIQGTPEWARYQVQRAVHQGRLSKPARCEHCGGAFPKEELQGHHWHGDYSGRPLDVQWMCSLCHGASHRLIDATAGMEKAA